MTALVARSTGSAPAIVGIGMTAMSLRRAALRCQLRVRRAGWRSPMPEIEHGDVDGLLVGSSQGVRPDRLGVGFAAQGGFAELRLLEHVEIKGATTIAMVQRAR